VFNRPGNEAPLRTDSGNIKTHLKRDLCIGFQDRYLRELFDVKPKEEKQKYFNDLSKYSILCKVLP